MLTTFPSSLFNIGRFPMFVFTHGANFNKREFADHLRQHCRNIPDENIWSFENYTYLSHEEDTERHIEFLKFIWKTLEECDYNRNHMERKKNEERLKLQNRPWYRKFWF